MAKPVSLTFQPEWKPTDRFGVSDVYILGRIPVVPTRLAEGRIGSDFLYSAPDQRWATSLDRHLEQWEVGAEALILFLDEFWSFQTKEGGKGCASGHHVLTPDLPIHAVYVSTNDLNGCAQGIYHEYAHLRLEAMGIGIDQHDGKLLTNIASELYDSSVRFDVKRPMSAVLHGFYAWLMFTENDWQNYNAGVLTRDDFMQYSERNWKKIDVGWQEIDRYARWTADGADFWSGCTAWATDLLSRCRLV